MLVKKGRNVPRRGLTTDAITTAAIEYVRESGVDDFSLRELATRLGVKPASLYNHVGSANEIMVEVGRFALRDLCDRLRAARQAGDSMGCLISMAEAYRSYALENPELYKAIVRMPSYEDETLSAEGHSIMGELYASLAQFQLSPVEATNFGRAYRSAMHGFVSLEMNGYFRGDPDAGQSYRFLMGQIVASLDVNDVRPGEGRDR